MTTAAVPTVIPDLTRVMGNDPARLKAWSRFASLGLPTPRTETWRATRLHALLAQPYELPTPATPDLVTLDPAALPRIEGTTRLILVNGQLDGAHSDPLPDTVHRLTQANEPADPDDAFAQLNAVAWEHGLRVELARGELTLHLLHVGAGRVPLMISPRSAFHVGRDARLTVIEHYLALNDTPRFINSLTQLHAAEGAYVEHLLIEQENHASTHVSLFESRQDRGSHVRSHSVLLGGALVRGNVHPVLDGPRAHGLINGLYVSAGEQQHDNHMRVEHAGPGGESRQFYRGVLRDRASGVFTGRIVVHPGAQKTDAKQSSAALLLSDDARNQAQPQLEIYADDVKCTHGSTTGQLDREAIFYLLSRGLSPERARGLLTYAFAGESVDRIEHPGARDAVRRAVVEKLGLGSDLDAVLRFAWGDA